MLLSLGLFVVWRGCVCSRWWWRRRLLLLSRRRLWWEHITGSSWQHNKPGSHIEIGARDTGAQIEGCSSAGNGTRKHIDAVSFDTGPYGQVDQCILLLRTNHHLWQQCPGLFNQGCIEGREFVPVIILRMMMMHQYIMPFGRTTEAWQQD